MTDLFFPERVPFDRHRDGYSTITWVDGRGFHRAHVAHDAPPELVASMVRETFTKSVGAGFSTKQEAA